MSDFFSMDVHYSETEVNDILKPIYEDHVMLRRFLIDLQLLTRDDYGKVYQRTEKRIQIIDKKTCNIFIKWCSKVYLSLHFMYNYDGFGGHT